MALLVKLLSKCLLFIKCIKGLIFGNIIFNFCQAWKSSNQGRNNVAARYNREGIYITHSSRAFRDEEGKHFWVEIEIFDNHRVPHGHQGPYNITVKSSYNSFLFYFFLNFYMTKTDNFVGSGELHWRKAYKQ